MAVDPNPSTGPRDAGHLDEMEGKNSVSVQFDVAPKSAQVRQLPTSSALSALVAIPEAIPTQTAPEPREVASALHSQMETPDIELPLAMIPDQVPVQTFIECRTLAAALSDGMRTNRWNRSEGEIVLVYQYEGSPHYVRFDARDFNNVSGEQVDSYEALETLLVGLDQSVALLLHVVLVLVRESGTVRVKIDELASFTYPRIRNHEERLSRRRSVVKALQVIASLQIIGHRKEQYRDRDGQNQVVAIDEPLIEIVSASAGEIAGESGFLTIRAGAFLQGHSGSNHVLHQIGNIRPIAGIPCKRPSGALARDMALALLQLWREKARHSSQDECGAVSFLPIRRGCLIDRMSPITKAWLKQMLAGRNPGRALDYWSEAVELLCRVVIGQYKELGGISRRRRTWKLDWMQREIDIQPAPDISCQIGEIARRRANCS